MMKGYYAPAAGPRNIGRMRGRHFHFLPVSMLPESHHRDPCRVGSGRRLIQALRGVSILSVYPIGQGTRARWREIWSTVPCEC